MANQKAIERKQSEVSALSEKIKESKLVLLTDYRGISVEDVTGLRANLRKADSEYKVIKNNITRRALEEAKIEGLEDLLVGPTAVVLSSGDYLEPLKAVYEYAKNKVAFLKEHKDLPHYFIGSGNQYGATYSYAMCYWEEQMWIRTKSISCQEFFHGMQEIIVDDTPVTLFMGEDEQRPLAERVARFLPRVNGNYTIIDTKEFELKGISPEYRGTISHLVMHGVNNRVDAYMELFLRHPLSIRRYYRQFEY